MNERIPDNWRVAVVSPVYNERDNVEPFVASIVEVMDRVSPPGGYGIVLVNDGSTDGGEAALNDRAREYAGTVTVVHLSRNFGMEPAIHAGLDQADADAVIILDSDMQDDPAAFTDFIAKWHDGFDVVYAVRASREDSAARRFVFWAFYRLLGRIANIDLPADASNFALMDRRVADVIRRMPERNRFLRGLRAWTGFRQTGVPVARRKRYDRRTRLGLRGQWTLAMNAIFSFSYVPLFVFRIAGLCTLLASFVLICWALYHKLVVGLEVQAWASQFIATSFLGGINLLGIGIVGEYVARIHDEVKGRPNYIVRAVTQFPPKDG